MAGVKGRSGRRPKPQWAHVLAGTYRPDRHGPLPPGGRAAVLQAVAGGAPADDREPPADLVDGLDEAGRAFVVALYGEYDFGAAERAIVRTAAEAVSRRLEARAVVAREGLLVTDAHGRTAGHPALAIEQAAVRQLHAALRLLHLTSPAREEDD